MLTPTRTTIVAYEPLELKQLWRLHAGDAFVDGDGNAEVVVVAGEPDASPPIPAVTKRIGDMSAGRRDDCTVRVAKIKLL
jgi:hypothetical protein